jgi:hypothetical protein
MKKPVTVSADTLWRRLKGGQTCGQFNAEQNLWLSPEVLMVGAQRFDQLIASAYQQ